MLLLGLAAQGRAELPHTTLLPSSPSSYFGQVESVGTGGGILMPLNLSVSNLVEDHRMAEVFRESSKCFNETEGLGGGGYGDCGKAYDWAGGFTAEESDCSREVGYGCWFFLAKGTGIFVNVGRSLRVHNRCAAHKALGIARMTANSAVRYLNGSTTYNPKTKKNETQEERLTFEMHEAALPCTTGKVLDGRHCVRVVLGRRGLALVPGAGGRGAKRAAPVDPLLLPREPVVPAVAAVMQMNRGLKPAVNQHGGDARGQVQGPAVPRSAEEGKS